MFALFFLFLKRESSREEVFCRISLISCALRRCDLVVLLCFIFGGKNGEGKEE